MIENIKTPRFRFPEMNFCRFFILYRRTPTGSPGTIVTIL